MKRMKLASLLAIITLAGLTITGCTKVTTSSTNPTSSTSSTSTDTSSSEVIDLKPVHVEDEEVDPTKETFTVTFLDDLGDLLARVEVKGGEAAEYPGVVYNRSDYENVYTFKEWDQDISNVTSDMVVKGIYEASPIDGNFSYSVNSIGQYMITGYVGSATDLVIPSTYAGKIVSGISTSAFAGNAALKSVTIPSTIRAIGSQAFYYCTGLETVNFSEGLQGIASQGFAYCTSLKEINLPSTTYLLDTKAFAYCQALTALNLPDTLEELGDNCFEGCILVESLTIGSGLTIVGEAPFYGLFALTSITVSDDNPYFSYDGTGLYYNIDTTIDETSYYYNGIILIPNSHEAVESYSVKEGTESLGLYYASYTKNIKKIILPKSLKEDAGFGYIYSNVEEVHYDVDSDVEFGNGIFSLAESLTAFTLPSSIRVIPMYAFEETHSLKDVVLPDGVMQIENQAFIRSGLTSFKVPSSLRYLSSEDGSAAYTFGQCSNLTTFDWNNNNYITSIPTYCFSQTGITSMTIPDSVTSIGNYAFSQCTSLVSVEIPDTVTTVGTYIFQACSALTTFDFPANSTAKTIPNRYMWGCTSLTEIRIPDNVTTINMQAFYDCYNVKAIYIPSSVKTIRANVFNYDEESHTMACDIYYEGSEEDFGKITTTSTSFAETGFTYHYNTAM